MYQRSNSSAKEVHRGRQQKRISRQPLQSSSSSAAAAAAAVAAAGAEAAWRGLDRVRELCWQTIEREPQLGATTFEGMAEALSSAESAARRNRAKRSTTLCTGCHSPRFGSAWLARERRRI